MSFIRNKYVKAGFFLIFALFFLLDAQPALAFESACGYRYIPTGEVRCFAFPDGSMGKSSCTSFCSNFGPTGSIPDLINKAEGCTYKKKATGKTFCDDATWEDVSKNPAETRQFPNLLVKRKKGTAPTPAATPPPTTPAKSTSPTRINPYDVKDPDYAAWRRTAIIPRCAFDYKGCRDINSLLELGVNAGQLILSLVGALAFLMFIVGGFTMITSFGNAEKFKKGMTTAVMAVVGVLISLGAYVAVDLILDALDVSKEFRGL